jgi:phage shock protein A
VADVEGGDDQPATKGDLKQVRVEIRELEERLRAEIRAANESLVRELSGVVQRALDVNREQFEKYVSAVDEKYKDLPRRVTRLEGDVAELQARRPPPTPRRRTPSK